MIFDADHSFLPSNAFPQGGDCGAPGRKYLTLVVAVTPLLPLSVIGSFSNFVHQTY
jgi:hypothetical protein